MNVIVARLISALSALLLLVSCNSNPLTPISTFVEQSTSPYPAKEIYVTEGDIADPYVSLGFVEYTLDTDLNLFSDQADLREQAIEDLKTAAVARYGAKVDAIVGVEFQESPGQGFFSPSLITVKGIAIAFKSGKSYSKYKHKKKHKAKWTKKNASKQKSASKKAVAKEKAKTVPKKAEEEPEITPSELLK